MNAMPVIKNQQLKMASFQRLLERTDVVALAAEAVAGAVPTVEASMMKMLGMLKTLVKPTPRRAADSRCLRRQ